MLSAPLVRRQDLLSRHLVQTNRRASSEGKPTGSKLLGADGVLLLLLVCVNVSPDARMRRFTPWFIQS